jgi:hypothetical protein
MQRDAIPPFNKSFDQDERWLAGQLDAAWQEDPDLAKAG